MPKKKFIPWLVCDQDENKCPTLEELKVSLERSYDNDSGAYEFEISLVKENNKFGQQSCGWDGEDKIILFDSMNYGFDTIEELHKNLVNFYKRAEKKCKKMNDNKQEALY
jgi:hypothetical protein